MEILSLVVSYTLFLVIFLAITFRTQIIASLSGRDGRKAEIITDDEIQSMIKEKTGFSLCNFRVVESKRPYGMMIGIPGKPIMVLSDKVYKGFNRDELQYVVLHEIGHYIRGHAIWESLISLLLLLIGVLVLSNIEQATILLLSSMLMGLVIGVLNIQFARLSEYDADRFTVKKMDNPTGMITASHKFQKEWRGDRTTNKWVDLFFSRANPYANRIKMALEEIDRRKNYEKGFNS